MVLNRNVRNKKDAQKLIADLLLTYTGEAADARFRDRQTYSKQSKEEVAMRAAGNLLTSFTLDRPLEW